MKRTNSPSTGASRHCTARIASIKRAYRTLYMAGLPLAEAREQLVTLAETSEDVRQMLEFLDRSERSLAR